MLMPWLIEVRLCVFLIDGKALEHEIYVYQTVIIILYNGDIEKSKYHSDDKSKDVTAIKITIYNMYQSNFLLLLPFSELYRTMKQAFFFAIES